ncbi:MAG: SET domain-containing protein, partial [Planctomycetota bacterium]
MFSVRPSGIHGQGLFATRFIPADTVIGVLQGEHTTDDGAYVLWIDDAKGFRVENDLKFINHADAPNAVYYDDLTVAALRDIEPGEEITHNYLGDEAEAGDAEVELDFDEGEPVPGV